MIEAIVGAIAGPLKRAGFRKKGQTWNRSCDGLVQIVNLQRSRFAEPGTLDVTLNIGVLIEPVWSLCWGKPPPNFVTDSDCFPSFRVGQLMADFSEASTDEWFSASDGEDAAALGVEFTNMLSNRVLPLLEELQTEPAVKDFVEARPTLVWQPADELAFAVLAHRCGVEDQCEQLLNRVAGGKVKEWRDRVADVRRRLTSRSD